MWDALSSECQKGLRSKFGATASLKSMVLAVGRANDSMSTLDAAASKSGIDPAMLAAIGIQESGFSNVNEADGTGVGVGVFQITVSRFSGVNASQAGDLTWSAFWAATTLASNASRLASAAPGISGDQLQQMTIDSWNTGVQGQINRYNAGQSPDYHTSPNGKTGGFGNNYGSNVLAIMDCFH